MSAWPDGRSRVLHIGPFWSLLREPGVFGLVCAELAGRMPSGMGPLAVVLLVHGATGSYSRAGAVAGVFAVGQALGGPLQGRLIDRVGQTVVLGCGAVLFAASFLALAATGGHAAPLVMCSWAGLAGLAYPPLASAMQALWSAGFTGARLQTAYAFQSTAQEIIFIGGPLLVAGLVTWSSAAVAMAVAAGLSLTGTAAFASSSRSRAWKPVERSSDRAGPLRVAGIRTVVASSPSRRFPFRSCRSRLLRLPPAKAVQGCRASCWRCGRRGASSAAFCTAAAPGRIRRSGGCGGSWSCSPPCSRHRPSRPAATAWPL